MTPMRTLLFAFASLFLLLPAQAQVTLPIEVFGVDGRSVATESVTISASQGSQADRFYFVMYQPFYHLGGWQEEPIEGGGTFDRETMVDVRLNGGPWVQVRDENVTCRFPESNHGCIATGYTTVRFSMSTADLGAAADGANTLEFRYNGTEGVRSGFRVLYIGMMRPTDDLNSFVPLPYPEATDTLIDGTTFVEDDPDTWAAPAGFEGAASVSAGETLYTSEGILVDLEDAPITAACGTCHASDGRDLQYFGFSNKSIIARSRSHGLTETEGKQIAAYIRSLQFEYTDGTPATTNSPGTPWDPPYQPGPSGYGPNDASHPDSVDAYYWAAGAGWEWALDHDSMTVKYAFPASGDPANPGGINYTADGSLPWTRYKLVNQSEWGDGGAADRGTAFNMREQPIAQQFPDWNNWLADIAPIDTDESAWLASDSYQLIQDGFNTVFPSGDLEAVRNWKVTMNGDYFREQGVFYGSYAEPIDQHAILGGHLFRAVKVWELQHKYHMEDKADDLECDGSEQEWCEPLGWLGDMRTLFELGPHVVGTDFDAPPYVYGSESDNNFFNHTWYQIQMVVNPGTPGNGGSTPVDEGYQEAFLEGGCDSGGCGIRQLFSEWKLFQIYSNDLNQIGGVIPGNTEMDRVLKVVATGWRKNGAWDQTRSTPQGEALAERLIEAFIRATNTYMVGENGNPGRLSTVQRLSGAEFNSNGFTWPGIEYQFDTSRLWLPTSFDYAAQIYSVLSGSWIEQDQSWADFFPNMSRGAIDSLAAQGDLIVPDDRDDGYAGEVANGWPSGLTRWHDMVSYTAPPPQSDLPTPMIRDRGAAPATETAIPTTDRYVVRAGHGAPGDLSVRHGISDPNKPTVADGETCAFTISNLRRIDDGDDSTAGSLPYHAWAGVCIGDVCTRLYRSGISADIQNVSTGEFGDRLPGQVSPPATVSMTCNGTTCTGTVDGVTVGSVSDPTPASGGICSTDGEIGERDPAVSSFSVEWSAAPAH